MAIRLSALGAGRRFTPQKFWFSFLLRPERFQSKVLRMIEDAPWHVRNMVIRRDLQKQTVKQEIRHAPQCTPKQPSSEPHGATRQQAIAKTHARRSAYRILSLIVLFVV
jgi:hypothetical protein